VFCFSGGFRMLLGVHTIDYARFDSGVTNSSRTGWASEQISLAYLTLGYL